MTNEEMVQLIQSDINPIENLGILFQQNIGFITKIVKKYDYVCKSSYDSVAVIEFDELINEAYFGIVEAAKKYNSNKETLFLTYAEYWIRRAIRMYLYNCGRMVRVPVNKQQQIYRYNQVGSYYRQNFDREPTEQEYASWLQIDIKIVYELEKFMYQGNIKSLDEFIPGGEDESMTFTDLIIDSANMEDEIIEKVTEKQLKAETWDIVHKILKEQTLFDVIKYRFIDKLTLRETAKMLGLSIEKVRQLESKALRKLRQNSLTKDLMVCI